MRRIKYLVLLLAFLSCTQPIKPDLKIDNSHLAKADSVKVEITDSIILEQSRKERRQFLDDMVNHRNTVWVKELTYRSDAAFNRYAVMNIENTTKELVIGIRFELEGTKGCYYSYEVKEKVRLKPGNSIALSKLLKEGECEYLSVKLVHYVLEDGTLRTGFN